MNTDSRNRYTGNNVSDKELCKQVSEGSIIAFELLHERHARRVFSLCLRMLENTHEAEDLAQEVWIQFFRKAKSFRGDAAFTTWLHRLAVNQVLMHFRSKKCKIQEDLRDDFDSLAEKYVVLIHDGPAILQSKIALDAAIAQLPPGYKNVFVLHDVEGYEHEEVAKILGCSLGTSKSQLHKARLKMRRLVNQKVNPRLVW